MDFQEFLQYLPKLIAAELPALEAHIKMVPLDRLSALKQQSYENINPKTAAVLILCYPKHGKTHIVLIVRNTYEGVHSAQIAFPGGKKEEEDVDFAATAIRETFEEVGVQPHKMEVIKPFTQVYIPPSNFMVHPFLAISREEISFIPDPSEVDKILELPLAVFLSDANVVKTKMNTSYANTIVIPAFKVENHIIWGATAMILSELKDILKVIYNVAD